MRLSPFVVVGILSLSACKDSRADAYAAFLKDKFGSSAAFQAKYPAGKSFEMAAKVREKGECGSAICDVSLEAPDKMWMLFELPPTQTGIKQLKPGQSVIIKCVPVYEGGSLKIDKSCTVSPS